MTTAMLAKLTEIRESLEADLHLDEEEKMVFGRRVKLRMKPRSAAAKKHAAMQRKVAQRRPSPSKKPLLKHKPDASKAIQKLRARRAQHSL